MVLDNGQILEFGSHQELLNKDHGHYKSLYEMQFIDVA
jgi:ABC-type multidrug transport system fused ATPase/permease subunit